MLSSPRAVIKIYNISKDELHKLNKPTTNEDGSIVVDFLTKSSYGNVVMDILKNYQYDIIKEYTLYGDLPMDDNCEIELYPDW